MKTYKLYIREYNIIKNDYVVREEIVKTNDIYHEIGKIYCKSIVEIKRIDYEDITDKETKDIIDIVDVFNYQEDLRINYEKQVKELKGLLYKVYTDINFSELLCCGEIEDLFDGRVK